MTLKVVHLAAGELSEGAARGAYWLHKAQQRRGLHSTMIISGTDSHGDTSVVALGNRPSYQRKVAVLCRLLNLPIKLYPRRARKIFSTGFFGVDYWNEDEFRSADVVHLHWFNELVSLRSLRSIGRPVVWTLRDMWPMTGGCHYSAGCERFKIGCGACPQLGSDAENDLSRWVVRHKRSQLSPSMRVVGISPWLSDCARESAVFQGFSVSTILNNVDVTRFDPMPRAAARQSLGLPADKKIILVGAHSLDDHYKGFDLFVAALKTLDLSKVHVVLFGRSDVPGLEWLGSACTRLGFLGDDEMLRRAYSAADVFVAPSREEAFGKTLVEAMACTTPVVCFDATGPRSIVEHRVNGYKARPFDVGDLADGIRWILDLDDESALRMGGSGRALVLQRFDSSLIAAEYENLYLELLAQRDGICFTSEHRHRSAADL